MEEKLKSLIRQALGNLNVETAEIILEHPGDPKNGDFSTNIAMVLAKKIGYAGGPLALAKEIVAHIPTDETIEKVELAGPGFINFSLSRDFFVKNISDIVSAGDAWGRGNLFSGKKIMVEYTDPNPFKPFHIGHLMSNAIGESISRLIESQGAKTIRANYQGDVGLHVAKAIYGLQMKGMPGEKSSISSQAIYIGECYSFGSNAYDENPDAKEKITAINKAVYERSDSEINKIYDWGRKVTLEAFEILYKHLGTKFDYYFFEGAVAKRGVDTVRNNNSIFEESDGAIVFHGEKYDSKLHTRVFINAGGLPTYETKEIGLTLEKFDLENPDTSIVITANEQADYFRVVTKAITIMYPEIGSRMQHISHGMLRFAEGKMSSRKGNIITGESLLADAKERVLEKMKDREFDDALRDDVANAVSVAALKYSILKQSMGADIVYDFEKSISFDGDSGPYLQYGAIRAKAILEKAASQSFDTIPEEVFPLERLLYRFPAIVARSAKEYAPHHIVNFLVDCVASFNSFYAQTQILNEADEYSPYKIALTKVFFITMQNGLALLGMRVPEKM